MEGPEEEEETGFSYARHVPPHPLLPISCPLTLHLLHPTGFFFFCPELFKMLCVLSFMFAVVSLCSERCVSKHHSGDISSSPLITPGMRGAPLTPTRFMASYMLCIVCWRGIINYTGS